MFTIMRAFAFAATMLALFGTHHACAQYVPLECPHQYGDGSYIDGYSRTLTGSVIFHNDLRQWLSLKLDETVCGLKELQLVHTDANHPMNLEVFRGCRVVVTGILGLPATTYYSAELYQDVESVEPARGCVRKPPFPDYSKLKPPNSLHAYRVEFWFNYFGPQGPLHGTVTSGNRQLQPWQVYATTYFNGGFGLTAGCAEGFSMGRWHATPEAKPWISDNQVLLDPEWAAQKHINRIHLAFTCAR